MINDPTLFGCDGGGGGGGGGHWMMMMMQESNVNPMTNNGNIELRMTNGKEAIVPGVCDTFQCDCDGHTEMNGFLQLCCNDLKRKKRDICSPDVLTSLEFMTTGLYSIELIKLRKKKKEMN
ncbi:hypothetical protein BLOT_005853 [Blomia tropicalis]|nr:hypothetical protein BLOT_005853 [Blomia tropicalis]